ncbi:MULTISPECIES: hypothetical protein [Polaribacter]|uniref:Uncharacterized protein n=1 Tax=Polaribacter sejongensis TaxID=985043 RepID=A0AAJ1QUL7_9FLAO|nr:MULTISPECIES: hypothetical protein [Polaribacter]AUC21955.1 hypothetical protein BTO15_07505 [Polaribacter sejongensis]MDN3618604.1 hypothetical protein [Polaribacter undariae]UWD30415.1 hypothetical protein NQP51_09705 [Polaribacter undariae]
MTYKLLTVKKYLILFIFIIAMLSCSKKKEDKTESLKFTIDRTLGKKLILPDSLMIYAPFSNYLADSLTILNSKYKVFSKINASCGDCVQNIKEWKKLSLEFRKYNIPIILICQSTDDFGLLKYTYNASSDFSLNTHFFLDSNNEFLKLNTFMNKSDHFETVLTNKKNEIILMGNPTKSNEIKNLYINEFKKE